MCRLNIGWTCHWWDDGHGGAILIPGCAARANNPEECTCEQPWDELPRLRRELAAALERLERAERRYGDLHAAVLAHPDANTIYATADRLAAARQGVAR